MAGIDGLAAEKVEALAPYEPIFGFFDELEEIFGQDTVDDITDIDNEDSYEYTYLVTLNREGIRFSSEELEGLLLEEDAYFLCLAISREKPLATMEFWKYPCEAKGQVLETSEVPFLQSHEPAAGRFDDFVRTHGLVPLTGLQLEEQVFLDGRPVSLYYKYFNRSEEDPYGQER